MPWILTLYLSLFFIVCPPFHDFLNLENEEQAGNGSVDMLSALWKLTTM
jgi:hypothetical protein